MENRFLHEVNGNNPNNWNNPPVAGNNWNNPPVVGNNWNNPPVAGSNWSPYNDMPPSYSDATEHLNRLLTDGVGLSCY